jgi:type II secretion system protein G
MLQRLRERAGREEGFTLVELLVVMLILGILAAIAIPSFFNQRDKANDADAKSGVKTAQTAMETYATDNNGEYTGAVVADLTRIEPTLNEYGANLTLPVAPGANTYTVRVTSETGNWFELERLGTGALDVDCATREDGGCPVDGNWD